VLGLVKRNFRKVDETDFLILYGLHQTAHGVLCAIKLGLLICRKVSTSWRRSSKELQRSYLIIIIIIIIMFFITIADKRCKGQSATSATQDSTL